jgi:hypothetical protein
MSDATRSERACPVCGQHRLAIEEAPHIDVMGVQAYSDMLGMGDLQQMAVPAIVCLACGSRWRDLAAFERNEVEPAEAGAGGQPEVRGGHATAEVAGAPESLDDDPGRPDRSDSAERP